MTKEQRAMLEGMMRMIPSITAERASAALDLLEGKLDVVEGQLQVAAKTVKTIPTTIKREDAAKILGCCTRKIDYLVAEGLLTKVNPNHSRRSMGYTYESVMRLAQGWSAA